MIPKPLLVYKCELFNSDSRKTVNYVQQHHIHYWIGDYGEQRLLISVQAENTIRLLPPLTIDDEQTELMISTTCLVIDQFTGTGPR